jgi:hypothetical protein
MTTGVELGEWDSNPQAILGESKVLILQIILFQVPKTPQIRMLELVLHLEL